VDALACSTETFGQGDERYMSTDRGLELKLLRIARGLPQYQVAAAVGVSPGILWQLESGRRPVPDALAARIRAVIEGAQPIGPEAA
jgi:DNA-binding XRE family transcriptional regulator